MSKDQALIDPPDFCMAMTVSCLERRYKNRGSYLQKRLDKVARLVTLLFH